MLFFNVQVNITYELVKNSKLKHTVMYCIDFIVIVCSVVKKLML